MARSTGLHTFVAELTAQPGEGDTPVVIEGASTQTADLFLIEKSDGTDLFKVSPDGNITVAGTATITGAQTFTGAATFNGAVTLTSTLDLTGSGATVLGGALTVTGAQTFTGATTHNGDVTFGDAKNIIVNATTGTKIGTATTQKLGFFNATPVAQPSAYTQTFSTADKTHAADGSVDLATTATTQTSPWGFATQAQGDAIATQFNLLRTTVGDVKQLVNSVIDDLQALGLIG